MMQPNNREEGPVSSTRTPLIIDLNESPVSSTSSPHTRSDQDFVFESESCKSQVLIDEGRDGGDARVLVCGACRRPEAQGDVVVCDGCEQGFHLACAGLEQGRGREISALTDWLCSNCLDAGASSKRWPLGVKDKRILDINCSPPSDIETETPDQLLDNTGKHFSDLGGFGDGLLDVSIITYQNNSMTEGFKLPANVYKLGVEGACRTNRVDDGSFDVKELRLSCEGFDAGIQFSQSFSDILLRSLKQYVEEKNSVLEDGWSVELKNGDDDSENTVTYKSPDGKRFGSMGEVALHLGLVANVLDGRDGISRVPQKINLPKKQKSRKNAISKANSISESGRDFLSCSKLKCTTNTCNDIVEPACGMLPVQFEDYFVLSVGKIDPRSTYHGSSVIWPVEFKSLWHDKITRSVFECEVLEGSNGKPVFKIQRFSCSSYPIPSGCTVLCPSRLTLIGGEGDGRTGHKLESESDDSIEVILSRKTPPNESDILYCLQECLNEDCIKKSDNLGKTISDRSLHNHLDSNSDFDEVGEIYVEESSSSLAWKSISQKLVNACRNLCTEGRVLKFFCDHADHNDSLWVIEQRKSKGILHPLTKFCSYPCTFNAPSVHRGDLDPLFSDLLQWLEEDRFGFDCEFVQEIMEKLLEVNECAKYQPLMKRTQSSEMLTVENRNLVVVNCTESVGIFDGSKKSKLTVGSVENKRFPSSGNLLLSKVPVHYIGDLCQIWESLMRFHKVLGMEVPFSLSQLEAEIIDPCFDNTYSSEKYHPSSKIYAPNDLLCTDHPKATSSSSCTTGYGSKGHCHSDFEAGEILPFMVNTSVHYFGAFLSKAHSSLVNVLISEILSKAASVVNPYFCLGEAKLRKGRRKDANYMSVEYRQIFELLPINDLTWPEVVRRYILSFLTIGGGLDVEIIAREASKIHCCLGGDGGILCGSLTGVAGMEADAFFLADATKQVFGGVSDGKEILMVEDQSTSLSDCEPNLYGNIPEWAQRLEPVRKLPTNVGTRIRKCVQDALEKCPPEWAKKRLEHSISKDVYKGNASGPTKKAVLAVLSDVLSEGSLTTFDQKVNKKMIPLPIADVIMKRCRIVLRHAASVDEDKSFCTLLGRIIVSSGDHSEEGLLGSPAFVSRPLDFRVIDHRLSAGAYGGSHESFVDDVRELWDIIRIAFSDQPDVIELADNLFQKFESLYETEVLALARKLEEYGKLDQLNENIQNEIKDILVSSDDVPRAPWDEGLCKVCGIDRDDESVLLCDSCDGEYHTYCLAPPLARIPEGNWYCPSCSQTRDDFSTNAQILSGRCHKMCQAESASVYLKQIACLADAMEEKEYWDLSVEQRIHLLKFLSDELLSSSLIRQHFDLCSDSAGELQQKLRSLYSDLKILTSKDRLLSARVSTDDAVSDGSAKPSNLPNSENDLDPICEKRCNSYNVDKIVTDNDKKHNSSLLADEQAAKNNRVVEDTTSDDIESVSAKGEELKLEKSIQEIERELFSISLRKEFLGSDSEGRLYWGSLTDHRPLIIVDGTVAISQRNEFSDDSSEAGCSWFFYETDTEIQQLVSWLKDFNSREKSLKDAILQWMNSRLKEHLTCKIPKSLSSVTSDGDNDISNNLLTRASMILEKKYGQFLKFDPIDNKEKLCRCVCLEPVWFSRYHCDSCHKTLPNSAELEHHNCGNLPLDSSIFRIFQEKIIFTEINVSNEHELDQNLRSSERGETTVPFKFEEISTIFRTQDSIKDLVSNIGLLGSHGIPSLLSSPMAPSNNESESLSNMPTDLHQPNISSDTLSEKYHEKNLSLNCMDPSDNSFSDRKLDPVHYCSIIPHSSLQPVVGRSLKPFIQLKVNLLDMEAALSNEAFRFSKAHTEKKLAWRAYVKSASSIYQLLLATIALEEMINFQYLKNKWWYWSSLTAAVRISTISSLSLRIYSLDSAILYEKFPESLPIDKSPAKSQPVSETVDKCRIIRKSTRKRKETENVYSVA